jgi:hypothetical protein
MITLDPVGNPRKRALEDDSVANPAQRRKSSSPPTSGHALEVKSFQQLASFTKGDTQPLGKSQRRNQAAQEKNLVEESQDDILVTDPISSPNGNRFAQALGFAKPSPITPGGARRSVTTVDLSSHGKNYVGETPESEKVRRAFGFNNDMEIGGGLTLSDAFMATPNQVNTFESLEFESGPDPVFLRPSPAWVRVESPANYRDPLHPHSDQENVFRQPQQPASAIKHPHDPILDSDDIFGSQRENFEPTQPELRSIRSRHSKPDFVIRDLNETQAGDGLADKSPLLTRKKAYQTPRSKLAQSNDLGAFSISHLPVTESLLRNSVVVAATPNSDKVTDSQSHSQPLPRANLPSSPPLINITQSQEPMPGLMGRLGDLDTQARAALNTSIPEPPNNFSDLPNSSARSGRNGNDKATFTRKSKDHTLNEAQDVEIGDVAQEATQLASSAEDSAEEKARNVQYAWESQARILGEIAAEPSQTAEASFRLELFEQDEDLVEVPQQSMNLSGSSPVDPRRRRNRPLLLEVSPIKSQSRSTSQRSSAPNTTSHPDTEPSQRSTPNLELINSVHDELDTSPPKSTMTRPQRFLQDEKAQKNKRKKVMEKNKQAGRSIFEFEETQLATQFEPDQDEEHAEDEDENELEQLDDAITNTEGLPIRFPRRVFAYCKNPYNACYAATFLGANKLAEGRYSCEVVFDDGTNMTVPPGQAEKWIFKLELRIGDLVKVEGKKSKLFVVAGFMPDSEPTATGVTSSLNRSRPLVDVFGCAKVVLEPKSKDSMGSVSDLVSSNTIIEPISNIFIPPKEFHRYASRVFTPPQDALTDSKKNTPLATRTAASSRQSSVCSPGASPTPTSGTKNDGSSLFSNMAFAISIDNEEKKRQIVQLVRSSGGQILENGFEELFDLSDSILGDFGKSVSSKASLSTMSYPSGLEIAPAARDLGFTAVIAESHSRKEKHMQALALGLPVLHLRWVEDCVTRNNVVPWTKYLLPAGQSSYLGGAVRSRYMDGFDAVGPEANLQSILDRRALLLRDKRILVIPGGSRGQVISKRQRSFIFLMMVLGLGSLRLGRSLRQAESFQTNSSHRA